MLRSILFGAGLLLLVYLGLRLFKVKEYTSLEDALDNPSGVEFLNLGGKSLLKISPTLSQLDQLEILWLDHNPGLDLAGSMPTLKSIPKLRALVLSADGLDSLPGSIDELKSLTILDLSENPGLNLNQTFSALSQVKDLTALSLCSNNLSDVPDNLGLLKQVKKIFWLGNHFSPETEKKIQTMLPECNMEFRED